jgi:hypothetical protein
MGTNRAEVRKSRSRGNLLRPKPILLDPRISTNLWPQRVMSADFAMPTTRVRSTSDSGKIAAVRRTDVEGHVWRAPGWQGFFHACSSGRSSHVFGLLVRLGTDGSAIAIGTLLSIVENCLPSMFE